MSSYGAALNRIADALEEQNKDRDLLAQAMKLAVAVIEKAESPGQEGESQPDPEDVRFDALMESEMDTSARSDIPEAMVERVMAALALYLRLSVTTTTPAQSALEAAGVDKLLAFVREAADYGCKAPIERFTVTGDTAFEEPCERCDPCCARSLLKELER